MLLNVCVFLSGQSVFYSREVTAKKPEGRGKVIFPPLQSQLPQPSQVREVKSIPLLFTQLAGRGTHAGESGAFNHLPHGPTSAPLRQERNGFAFSQNLRTRT